MDGPRDGHTEGSESEKEIYLGYQRVTGQSSEYSRAEDTGLMG